MAVRCPDLRTTRPQRGAKPPPHKASSAHHSEVQALQSVENRSGHQRTALSEPAYGVVQVWVFVRQQLGADPPHDTEGTALHTRRVGHGQHIEAVGRAF